MTYGFIGLGNMAGAIIAGMRVSEKLRDADILGFDISRQRCDEMRACVRVTDSARETAREAEVIVLAVKPQVLGGVLEELAADGVPGKLVISIAAGKALAFYEERLGEDVPIIRVMPNINARVLAATSAFAANAAVTEAQKGVARDIFSAVGTVTELPETLFPVFSAVGGASPAFAYMYIDALARAAVRFGMPRQQALAVAASTVYGSAKMILDSGEHPWALTDQVCSPGGTTVEGVLALQKLGFEHAVHEAIAAVVEKDKRL